MFHYILFFINKSVRFLVFGRSCRYLFFVINFFWFSWLEEFLTFYRYSFNFFFILLNILVQINSFRHSDIFLRLKNKNCPYFNYNFLNSIGTSGWIASNGVKSELREIILSSKFEAEISKPKNTFELKSNSFPATFNYLFMIEWTIFTTFNNS